MADAAVGHRITAAGAVVGLVVGAVTVTVAVVAGPGLAAAGYVSEAGTDTYPLAGAYQIGVYALAAGLVLLAAALVRLVRVAAALLVTAGFFIALSGAVTCSAGCPLPPFEPATTADLVHGGAGVAGAAAFVFAIVATAVSATVPPVPRRLSVLAAGLTLPLAVTVALAMLLVGRGALIGVLERVVLVAAAVWAVVIATLRAHGGAFVPASSSAPAAGAEAGPRSTPTRMGADGPHRRARRGAADERTHRP